MDANTSADPQEKRRLRLLIPGIAVLILLLGMSAFNAFAPMTQQPGSPIVVFLFAAITVLLFVLLLLSLVLLARNILKMYGDGRSRVLGSRLRSRMLLGALLLSFAPIVFMALFSFLLMNRSLDRWFSQPVAHMREQSLYLATQLSRYVTANARDEAESIARSPEFLDGYNGGSTDSMIGEMRKHRITLEGGFVFVYRDGMPIASYQTPYNPQRTVLHNWQQPERQDGESMMSRAEEPPPPSPPAPPPHPAVAPFNEQQTSLALASLRGAEDVDGPLLSVAQGNNYALGAAGFDGGGVVVVALPLPPDLGQTMGHISEGAQQYWAVYRERRTLRSTFLLLLTLVTTLTFFASTWLALFLSKQITRPVEALADAMDAIAAGDYRQRISFSASEELSDLIASFNQMATDLEESRMLADSSVAQIEGANRRLQERQHELELILETIPSGVVVLDGERNVLQVNRAFVDLLTASLPAHDRLAARGPLPPGLILEDLLPSAILEDVLRLERRAQRMGVAGVELELPLRDATANRPVHGQSLSLSVTVAVLSLGTDGAGHQRRGSVLVVDDVSEVLQAQRQVAWKEVAQRVAHEIKNPLTPIALSAERILRHIGRGDASPENGTAHGNGSRNGLTPAPANGLDSAAIIRRCSEVILSSVETMRLLVDQFGALAEFPRAQPRTTSLNDIAESALLLFQDRLEGIQVETAFAPQLPPVLADPESLRRALANLIDNAAEAMSASLHRVLRVQTSLGEQPGMAEIRISDSGPGVRQEVRDRLFLPYFSTKARGTGLGLAIAAKIIQDHQGRIRAEQPGSFGACFILELPLARVAEPEPAIEPSEPSIA
jgi:two-component system nitrogen regulation sensor histidine kinase NtrY